MVGVTNSYYSITELQGLADFVKFRLFDTAIAAAAEASVYDLRLLNFLGKLTTLQFIPGAVDYWGDQLSHEMTGGAGAGTREILTYPDRREGLWKVFADLQAEVQAEYPAMAETYGFRILGASGKIPRVSYGDGDQDVLVTRDPNDFPPIGVFPSVDLGLVWSSPQ